MKNNKKVKINFSILRILPNSKRVSSLKNSFFPKNHKAKSKIFHYNFLPENRKGLSAVITTLILIALVIAAIAIIWVTVTNLLTNKMEAAESCINIFDKVEINERYTCYDKSDITNNKTHFSISIKDIDVGAVIVSIEEGTTKTSKTYKIPGTYSDVKNYASGGYGEELILPDKNAGLTYVSKGWPSKPDSIKIAPVINGNQCEVSDLVTEIYSC